MKKVEDQRAKFRLYQRYNEKLRKWLPRHFVNCDGNGNFAIYEEKPNCFGVPIHRKVREIDVAETLKADKKRFGTLNIPTFQQIFGRGPVIPKPRKKTKTVNCDEQVKDIRERLKAEEMEHNEAYTSLQKQLLACQKGKNVSLVPKSASRGDETAPGVYFPASKNNLAKVLGNKTVIHTSAEKIPASYAVMDLRDLIASHKPDFSINPFYPANCQEREYDSNKQLQHNVTARSRSFEPMFLITNSPTAEDGPPIVNSQGVVLGGNSRVLILQSVFKSGKFYSYTEKLEQDASIYGLSGWRTKINNGVLVRLIDDDNSVKCSHYSRIFNTSTKNETDDLSLALSLSKYLQEKELRDIGDLIEQDEAESVSDIFNSNLIRNKLHAILQLAGVINATNTTKFIEVVDGKKKFSAGGRLLLEQVLLAAILKERKVIQASKKYANKILKNIPYFLQIQNFGGKWNLLKAFKTAIILENSRSETGVKKQKDYLAQTDAFKAPPTKLEQLAWQILEVPQLKFKKFMEDFIKVANTQTSNKDAFIPSKTITPEAAIETLLAGEREKLIQSLSDKSKRSKKTQLSDRAKRHKKCRPTKSTLKALFLNDPIVKFFYK